MRPKHHLPCDHCGSSDALTDYGLHTHCFSCNNHTFKEVDLTQDFPFKDTHNTTTYDFQLPDTESVIPVGRAQSVVISIDKTKFVALTDCGVARKTAEFYGVWVNDRKEHVYPYFDPSGKKHVANQFRTTDKKGFMVQGDYGKTALFGQQLFPAGSAKQVTVVEGAKDALSAFEMTGSKYPVVAVKSASSARKDVADNFEYLNSFDKIVVCFDKDDEHKQSDGSSFYPGQEAAAKVAAMFPLGKVRLMTLRKAKDANDYLKAGWAEDFRKEWWDAPNFTPQGIRLASDMWEEVKAIKEYDSATYPWQGLQELTYGLRMSEVVLITADTGVGKTSFAKELEHHLLKTTDKGVGLMHLEESNKDTILGLMSITANRPLHLPDVRSEVLDEELKVYFDDVCGTERVVVWDHFGSNSVASVLQTIQHMNALGCKYIILDHLSIVVSDQNGDERKQLDEISTKLKTLCMELDCCIIAIIHINRQGQVRGSAGPEQIANLVVRLTRDKLSEDEEVRNTTKVSVEKNRFSGRTGPACALKYDGQTGRLVEMPKETFLEMLNNNKKKIQQVEEW